MLILGLGYTSGRLAAALRADGWRVTGTRREAAGEAIAFADEDAVRAEIAAATHILSSVPPAGDADPVLARYGAAIAAAPARWTGYLSTAPAARRSTASAPARHIASTSRARSSAVAMSTISSPASAPASRADRPAPIISPTTCRSARMR